MCSGIRIVHLYPYMKQLYQLEHSVYVQLPLPLVLQSQLIFTCSKVNAFFPPTTVIEVVSYVCSTIDYFVILFILPWMW